MAEELRNRRPAIHVLPWTRCLHEYPTARILCIWEAVPTSVKLMWTMLHEELYAEDHLLQGILKIRMSLQRCDNRRRFDLLVMSDRVYTTLERLKQLPLYCRFNRRYDERVRYRQRVAAAIDNAQVAADVVPHQGQDGVIDDASDVDLHLDAQDVEIEPEGVPRHPQNVRGGERVRQGLRQNTPSTINFMSLNVHALQKKRSMFRTLLDTAKISIAALQETRVTEVDWRVNVHTYYSFESVATPVGGENGLLLLVKRVFGPILISSSPHHIAVKATIADQVWYIMNVYIPPINNTTRRRAKSNVYGAIRAIYNLDANARVLVMGDFNDTRDNVDREMTRRRHIHHLVHVQCTGSPKTFHGGRRGRWSAIDHVYVSRSGNDNVSRYRVLRSSMISDHFPVVGTFSNLVIQDEPLRQGNARVRFDRDKVRKEAAALANADRLTAFLNDITPIIGAQQAPTHEVIDQWFRRFVEITEAVAAEKNVLLPTNVVSRHPIRGLLSVKARKALRWKAKCFHRWCKSKGCRRTLRKLRKKYIDASKKAREEVRDDQRDSWTKHIQHISSLFTSGDMRRACAQVQTLVGRTKSGSAYQGPIQKTLPDGTVISATTPEEKSALWESQYRELNADVTGHSKDAEFWAEQIQGQPRSALNRMDDMVTWHELAATLRKLRSGKASGLDGTPPEVIKIALAGDDDREDINRPPANAQGRVLLLMVNTLFNNGIPADMNEAEIVSLHKKGDESDVDNYRGISLISVLVKVVTMIVIERIMCGIRITKRLSQSQAGFVRLEECVGQATALYEIIERRSKRGLPTYLAFLDLKKAYDMVPHEAMLRKLRLKGVVGKCFAFIKALYANSSIRIRLTNGHLSNRIALLRGLRQGCPASPGLFDIFIDDLADEMAARSLGVCPHHAGVDQVMDGPGIRYVNQQGQESKRPIGVLLFADDAVLLASSPEQLMEELEVAHQWSVRNEMEFSHGKCGAMEFCNRDGFVLHNRADELLLGAKPIPVVQKYSYLGIPFTADESGWYPDVKIMVTHRVIKGKNALGVYRHVLQNHTIPVYVKVLLLKQQIVSVLTYGCNIWAGSRERVQPVQRALDDAMKAALCIHSRRNPTSSTTMLSELGIAPIHARASAEAARAYAKYHESETVIGILCRWPDRAQGKVVWTSLAKRALSRLRTRHGNEFQYETRLNRVGASSLRRDVLKLVSQRYFDKEDTKSLKLWRQYNLHGVVSNDVTYIKAAAQYAECANGVRWLTRVRISAFYYQNRLSGMRVLQHLPGENTCFICGAHTGEESRCHLLLRCTRWNAERSRLLGSLWGVGDGDANDQNPRQDPSGMIGGISRIIPAQLLPEYHDRVLEACLLGGGGRLVFAPGVEVTMPAAIHRQWVGCTPPDANSSVSEIAFANSIREGYGEVRNEDDSVDNLLTYRPFLRVARYLSIIVRSRQAYIQENYGDVDRLDDAANLPREAEVEPALAGDELDDDAVADIAEEE